MKSLRAKRKQKKVIAIVALSCFLSLYVFPFAAQAAEFGMSVDLLIQSGMNFYSQGRLFDAMQQFKKVLILDPRSQVASSFLKQIQKEVYGDREPEQVSSRSEALQVTLDEIEQERKSLKGVSSFEAPSIGERARQEPQAPAAPPILVSPEKTILLSEIPLEQTVLDLSKGSQLLLKGDAVKRFLNSNPEYFSIERYGQDAILITGNKIGRGVFHVWDADGRRTFNLSISQTKLYKATKAEFERRSYESLLSSPFVVTYSWDKGSFHSGRRLDTTERSSLSINQNVFIRGETPYGFYDASFSIDRLNKKYEIFNLSTGLTDAHFWGLEHLNIRLLDYGTGINSFLFPNADLRGVRLDAPMFNSKLRYTAFWGGIPEGTFARLQPGLFDDTVDAYLYGLSLFYDHSANAKYKMYVARSYGSEINRPVLTHAAYGFGTFHKVGKVFIENEIAYDGQKSTAFTSSANWKLGKTDMGLRYTELNNDFVSPLGGNPGGGSSSMTLTAGHSFNEDLYLTNSFTAQRDRNKDFINRENPDRPNYYFDNNLWWQLDAYTSMRFGYARNDTKGSVSTSLSESETIGFNRKIFFLKPISTYFTFINSRNKNFTGSTSNFNRQGIQAGISLSLTDEWSFNISQTNNFIRNRVSDLDSSPTILETGLNYYSRILQSPFYLRGRVFYRDEEETESDVSFLSGEDRLEFQAGLDYRPTSNLSAYLSLRAANLWAEKEAAPKRFEADVRYGVSIAWDTGVRWNTKGNVHGFVFYDLDADGVRDVDEGGVEDVVLNAPGDKSDVTNRDGYYVIKGIVGKKASVSIDLNSIPRNYILTTPSLYEFSVSHGATKKFDFGVATRTDIVGFVFVDFNGNSRFDRGDEPIKGAVIVLDGKQESPTDDGGQFQFRKLSAGTHELTIDLKTIPTTYIPKVPLKSSVQLEEGQTIFFNIPLRQMLPHGESLAQK